MRVQGTRRGAAYGPGSCPLDMLPDVVGLAELHASREAEGRTA
ncbi:hypothetical protein HNP84_003694 [Thermocatellispora tengchongensis]|uniref:Uncharacterized protein n=1 Tax=Thermocatellispora tengchongensis TaxID=1073253 RepID=A0A840P2Q7_9ACTN|nr:hypothetical protein [Thermocatellispora tengchongensis]MBB5133968.1 hypothetical protein [Thermocatellispora tengchongensis]